MARIEGVDLRVISALKSAHLYLWHWHNAQPENSGANGIDPNTRVRDRTEAEVASLREVSASSVLRVNCAAGVNMNIKRLIEIGSYRGLRHRRNLPARGQRTKTNARTSKGPKKTVAGRGRRRGAKKK
jgi:small subunit ribosomal protein S13